MTSRHWTFLGAEPILGGAHDTFNVGTSLVASSNIEADFVTGEVAELIIEKPLDYA